MNKQLEQLMDERLEQLDAIHAKMVECNVAYLKAHPNPDMSLVRAPSDLAHDEIADAGLILKGYPANEASHACFIAAQMIVAGEIASVVVAANGRILRPAIRCARGLLSVTEMISPDRARDE